MIGYVLKSAWRSGLLVVTVTAFVTTLGAVVVMLQPKMYEARVIVPVVFDQEDRSVSPAGEAPVAFPESPQELIHNEVRIMSGSDLKLKTIGNIGPEALYPELVDVSNPLDEAIIAFGGDLDIRGTIAPAMVHVGFRHLSPDVAADTVNAMIEFYLAKRQKTVARLEADQGGIDGFRRDIGLGNARIGEVEPALPPSREMGLSRPVRLLSIGLIGFCLAVGLAVIRERSRPSLATAESVEKCLGIPVLATFSTRAGH